MYQMVQNKSISDNVELDRSTSTLYKSKTTALLSAAVILSLDDKIRNNETFNSLDKDKMRVLGTGVRVELKTKKVATKRAYEQYVV